MREYKYKPCEFSIIEPQEIALTHKVISKYIHRTPVLSSTQLNNWLGHDIFFKAEPLQKTGAFKVRGALSKILALKESTNFSGKVTAFSSRNHAQALAWAAKKFGINATIFLPENTSSLKIQATKSLCENVIITKTRTEAEQRTYGLAKQGVHIVPPYDDDDIIKGQGTSAYEALQDMEQKPDAIFAPCGGGGLLSGCYLAKELLSPESKIFGVEPKAANDASISIQNKKIYRFDDSPKTIADGVRTLSLSPRTFEYVSKTSDIIEISEDEIYYWTQWLSNLLKLVIEPTSALAMAGASKWIKSQTRRKSVLVILSGGNISPQTMTKIWKYNNIENLL